MPRTAAFGAFVFSERKRGGSFLYHSRKRPLLDLPEEITAIWSCTNKDCNGWMRDNFVFLNQPTCVQCRSLMEKGERMLSIVANTSPNQTKR